MDVDPIIVAAIAGWAFDDICPTPPRWPWPWPGPGPWWLRKFLALVGGAIGYAVINPQVEGLDIPSIVLIGGMTGILLPSLVSGVAAFGRRAPVDVDRQI